MLFKNCWYRTYFELVDAFRSARCPLCHLLSHKESALIEDLLASYKERKRRKIQLKALCIVHRGMVKEAAADDPSFLVMLKTLVKSSLWDLGRSSEGPTPRWRQWLRPSRVECPLCREYLSEEKAFCRALIHFLDDTDFWKGLQRAPLLCLNHLEKCSTVQNRSKGFERLLEDQSEKLNNLLDDLIRFEATGTNEECKSTVLDWFADFTTPLAGDAEAAVFSVEKGTPKELPSAMHDEDSYDDDHDPERVLFENEKLNRKVRDLLDRLNDVESRAASLHYRVAELTDINKRLELAYTGASTQANGLTQLVQDLRGEIKRLEKGKAENHSKQRHEFQERATEGSHRK
jgi:Family of unknown function (DUF6062)